MSRADRVAARLAEREVDALLVTDLANVRYLTGFTGTAGMAIVGPETRRFITDFRYVERAKAEVAGFDRSARRRSPAAALKEGWPEGAMRLGFEDHHVTVRQHARLRELLPDRIELVAAGGLVEAERARQGAGGGRADPRRRRARRRGLRVGAGARLAGRTEREVALALEQEMRRRGASEPCFPSIVASGTHGALPHAEPRDVEIPAGVLVTLDLGRAGRLLLGLHAHVATGEPDDDLRPSTSSSSAPSSRRWTRCGRARRAARSTRSPAT